uniref:DNA topoisomerase (ATP-hydrolyzing) n=1 Tax=Oryza punctata TaxID=4537 RepID=A0A0E0MI87_ORYPU
MISHLPLLDQILLRPDDHLGTVEKCTETLWVYESFAMTRRPRHLHPPLRHDFTNQRHLDPAMDALHVDIDVSEHRISVYSSGQGIPVELHHEEDGGGVYVPEIIVGHLLSSKEITGVKLANVFSTDFIVETADGRLLNKYKQVFSKNMGRKLEPEISDCKKGENWTRITFKPDLAKFSLTRLDQDDVVAVMRKRVFDVAAMLGDAVNVVLNGRRLNVKSFSNYVDWHIISSSKKRLAELPRICEKINDQWEVCVSSEGHFEQLRLNRMGGSHVDYMANKIATHVMNVANDKKSKNFTAKCMM